MSSYRLLWMLVLCFVCGSTLCSAASAADTATPIVAVNVNGVTDGAWLVIIKGGVPSICPAMLLTASPTPVPPGPGPGPIPTPDVLTERAKAIKAAADKVSDPNREETAANLAGLWGLIKQQVDAGKVTGQANIATLIKNGNQMVLGVVQQRQWKPVFDLFDSQWNDQVRDNSGDAALSGYLGEAVSGLKASAPGYNAEVPKLVEKDGVFSIAPGHNAESGGLKAINWERLLQILMMIMQLIGPLLS